MGKAKLNSDDRNRAVEELLKKSMEMIKHPPYTKEGFANGVFWESAEKYNLTAEQALAVRMNEHINVIEEYVKSSKKLPEPDSIEKRIIETIDCLGVLYTILMEKDLVNHSPFQKITVSGSPLEVCGSCGAKPDRGGRIYHEPSCKA